MTKVTINPGICGLITTVEATSEDQMNVTLKVKSACAAITKMMEDLGDTHNGFALCLTKPGTSPLHKYASQAAHFPGHAGCPTFSGIIKCVEVECHLALPKNVEIRFE